MYDRVVATPRLLARWLKSTAYRGLEVILVAPRQSAEADALTQELAQQGCKAIRIQEFDDACTPTTWVAERKRLLQVGLRVKVIIDMVAERTGLIIGCGAAAQFGPSIGQGARLAHCRSGTLKRIGQAQHRA